MKREFGSQLVAFPNCANEPIVHGFPAGREPGAGLETPNGLDATGILFPLGARRQYKLRKYSLKRSSDEIQSDRFSDSSERKRADFTAPIRPGWPGLAGVKSKHLTFIFRTGLCDLSVLDDCCSSVVERSV